MEAIDPTVMVRQVDALATDLRTRIDVFDQRARAVLTADEWAAIDQVYLIGDGDSYHACLATEHAHQRLAVEHHVIEPGVAHVIEPGR